jgi:hypothetical protein
MALRFFVSVRLHDGKGDAWLPRVNATPFSRSLLDCPDGFIAQADAEKWLAEVEADFVPAIATSCGLPVDAGIEAWSIIDGGWTPLNARAKEWADVDRG